MRTREPERSNLATRVRFRLRSLVSSYPSLFLPLMRRRPAHRGHIIDGDTEMVIEGYPRSGNTFAVAAFEFAQGRPVRIARHLHAPAHVIEGVRRGLPTLVVCREPVDAVTSQVIRHPGLNLADCLVAYMSFHRRLLPYRADIEVAPFDKVISDFGSVIEDVNRRYATNFRLFDHTPDTVEAVFAVVDEMERVDSTRRSSKAVDTVARPAADREQVKARLRELFDIPRIALLVEPARSLYQQFLREAQD